LGLVLSAWAVRSPLHSADSNFGRILTTDLPPPGYALARSYINAGLHFGLAERHCADDRGFS
jgi:hypothetical protein